MAIKTNERPGTRAVLRHCNMSSYKVREVLDLVRGMEFERAAEVLEYTDRAAAPVVLKLLRSAAANAEHNDGLDINELYIATAFADEGTTLKRWRPRARGRATRIRKRSCHITLILARMPDEKIARRRARAAANATELRARRVAGARRGRNKAAAGLEEATAVASFDADAVIEELMDQAPETEVVTTEAPETEIVESDVVESDHVETEGEQLDVETDDVETDTASTEEEGK
jgi:large subunit ribosomal protein L22